MSLQFIMGPSGAGKSHYLYHNVINESIANPDKNYIFLVPDQFKMQAEKALVMASPRKGLMNIEVLSFNRLAHRVFEETGNHSDVILDDIGKNFVIRRVAGEQEDNLKVLAGRMKKMGYVTEMKSIISEFIQYDIQSETLDEIIKNAEGNQALYYKLSDIKLIYEEFKKYLRGKYITGEELLDILASVANQSEMLKGSVLILDGFTGFTPVQNKLFRELMQVCEKITVSVTIDKNENPFVYEHPYQLFALSKQMVTSLIRIAKETKTQIDDTIYLYERPIWRFKENRALGFLEQNLFRYTKRRYENSQDAIQMWCAKRPQEEIDFVAQKIRELVRTKKFRYRDIAVISNDMSAYVTHIERIFKKYELPYFMDHKRSILLNSCVEFIRSLLAMSEQNFSYESVFRYLRTGLADVQRDEIDLLENYVLALGIHGYKKWQDKWIRRTKNMDEESLEKINQIRLQFVNSVKEVMEVLNAKGKTVLDVTQALHTFFLKEELQKRVKEYQMRFESAGDLALSKEYAQVYRLVIELFDQFVELLGDEKISIKEYCDLLDAGLEEAKVGIVPPSVDQIVVGDIERSRMSDIKVIFLVGVNDIYIPGSQNASGLLSEYDRNYMMKTGAILAPGTKEKTYIQKFYLYLLLTKPTEQVYLSFSKSSSGGVAIRPSYLVSDLMKLFADLKVREVPETLCDKELTKESGIECLIHGIQKKHEGLSSEWQELYTWYKKNPEWCKKVEELIAASFYQKPDSVLSRAVAKRLYGEILDNSVTRLEKYSACAYAHFLTYGLRLQEREEYQFQAMDLGNLFHGAIERFSNKLEKAGYTWGTLPDGQKETFIEESIEECIVDYGNSILYSSARNEYVIMRLKRMLRRTIWALENQLKQGDFVPKGYEIAFANNHPLKELGKMRLRGKIDRVDVYEDAEHVYVKVIDYKTGEKAFDLGELCYGLQLQLVVYLNVAMEMEEKKHPDKKVIPAGLFYYKMKDPIVAKQDITNDLDETILKELRPDGIVYGAEEVIGHLDRGFEGSSTVIPVSRLKSGGLSKTSKVLSEEDFRFITEFARKQVEKVGNEILDGKADVAPYEMGGSKSCDYCPYHAICGFDEKIPGYGYRTLEKVNQETALQNMRKEVETWE